MDLERDLSFDLYGRYALIRDIINSSRSGKRKYKILDVGGRGNLLKKFLEKDEITYLDPNIDSKDSNFIKADGCDMPLDNESFDWVVSADVLEHISVDKRNDFFEEQFRVTKNGIIVVAPFQDTVVENAEKNINNLFKEYYGIDHPWLIEHIQNGLPPIKILLDFAQSKKIKPQTFHNNEISLWELCQNFIINADKNKIDITPFFELYNKNYQSDLNQPNSYRKLVVLQKNSDKPIVIKHKAIEFSEFRQTITNFINKQYNRSFQEKQAQIDEFQETNINQSIKEKTITAQLYLSKNDSFNEELSMHIEIDKGPQFLCYDVSEFDNPTYFRFDPANIECAIRIDNIELEYEDGIEYVQPSGSNAILLDDNVYFFNNQDSNILLNSDSNRSIKKVIFRCEYLHFEKTTFQTLIDILNKKLQNNTTHKSLLDQMKKELVNEFFILNANSNNNTKLKRLENSLAQIHKNTSIHKDEINNNIKFHSKLEIEIFNDKFDKLAELHKTATNKLKSIDESTTRHHSNINNIKIEFAKQLATINQLINTSNEEHISKHKDDTVNFDKIHSELCVLSNKSDLLLSDIIEYTEKKYLASSNHLAELKNQLLSSSNELLATSNTQSNAIIENINSKWIKFKNQYSIINGELSRLFEEMAIVHKNHLKTDEFISIKFDQNKTETSQILKNIQLLNNLNNSLKNELKENHTIEVESHSLIIEKLGELMDFNQRLFLKKELDWKMDLEENTLKQKELSDKLELLHTFINSSKLRKYLLRKVMK